MRVSRFSFLLATLSGVVVALSIHVPAAAQLPPVADSITNEKPLPEFQILSAVYGSPVGGTDLTPRFERAAKGGLLVVFVEPVLIDDRKQGELVLRVKIGNIKKDLRYTHRKYVFLDSRPAAKYPPKGLTVLDAFYGTGVWGEDKMIDVKKELQQHIHKDQISVPVQDLVRGLPDPARGQSKVVIVRYALDGLVQTAMFEEHLQVAIRQTSQGAAKAMAAKFPGDGHEPGEEWNQNSLSLTFCWCPPGRFRMGSKTSEPDRANKLSLAQEDQVNVILTHGFWMSRYETTQAAWEHIMHTTLDEQRVKALSAESGGIDPDIPMTCVNYDEAVDFCETLTTLERDAGRLPKDWAYRLPTEAQWEYACRAGTTTATAFGDSLSSDQANFNGEKPYNKAKPGPKLFTERKVGSYKPNAWGIYDMHGNVDEWCQDMLSKTLTAGPDPLNQKGKSTYISRGGSCYEGGKSCRSASRGYGEHDYRSPGLGFRLSLVRLPKK